MPTQTLRLAVQGWHDAFAAATRMKALTGATFALALLLDIAAAAIGVVWPNADVLSHSLSEFLLKTAVAFSYNIIPVAVLVTPIAVAIIRHVVLEVVTEWDWRILTEARFGRFASLWIVINLLLIVVLTCVMITFSEMAAYVAREFALWPLVTTWALVITAAIISVILVLRTALLFAAIAVDAPRATWRNAMLDTMGHSWQVFFSFFLRTYHAYYL
jgi:hypothetical protein